MATAYPGISSITPSFGPADGLGLTLTVNGSGFAANSTILWNGSPVPTTFGSATQLTTSVGASLIAASIATAILTATPVLIAATGALLAEMVGVYNIGIEGSMLCGALGAVIGGPHPCP